MSGGVRISLRERTLRAACTPASVRAARASETYVNVDFVSIDRCMNSRERCEPFDGCWNCLH